MGRGSSSTVLYVGMYAVARELVSTADHRFQGSNRLVFMSGSASQPSFSHPFTMLWWNSSPGSSVLHVGFLHGHHLKNRKEVKGQLGIITELFWADSRRINGEGNLAESRVEKKKTWRIGNPSHI